jgi:DNA-directed RNA polymerase specialized sigma24 family protein
MTGLSEAVGATGVTQRADITGRDISRLEATYRLHSGRVYTLCLRLLADAGRAEEATARVFIRLGRERSGRPDEAHVRDLSIAEALESLRGAYVGTGTTAAPPSPGPLATARLDALAARLPDRQRAAFVLHYVEGLSIGAVAGYMRVDEAAARSLIREARVALRLMCFGRG